jgi:hypothetical protein
LRGGARRIVTRDALAVERFSPSARSKKAGEALVFDRRLEDHALIESVDEVALDHDTSEE